MGCNFKTCGELGTIFKLVALICLCVASGMISQYFFGTSSRSYNFMVVTAAGGVSILGLLVLLRLLDKESGKEPEVSYGMVWGIFSLVSGLLVLLSNSTTSVAWFVTATCFLVAGIVLLVDSIFAILKK